VTDLKYFFRVGGNLVVRLFVVSFLWCMITRGQS